MSSFPEAIGDIVQGALIARAVEPEAGEASTGSHETVCLNCGRALLGSYCHNCGQPAHIHRTLSAFFHDLLHGVFHFEGKIWRTLPRLAWRPGRLTREYIDGRRASYISPVALFLFVVFLTFVVFHSVGEETHVNVLSGNGAVEVSAQINAQITGLEEQRAKAVAKGRDTRDIDDQLGGLRVALSAVQTPTGASRLDAIAAWRQSHDKGLMGRINRAVDTARANPDLALFKLQYSAYKYSWLLIPLSVPFVWLLFPFNRQFKIYDHTVFVTYSLSFMYLMVAIFTLCTVSILKSLPDIIVLALILYVPFHMYRQLRETYALTRGAAVLRTGFLAVFAACVLTIWTLALLVMVTVG